MLKEDKKLEVGMYVRGERFGIGKINRDYYDNEKNHWYNVEFNCYGDNENHCGICETSIGFKASHDIIDLIEVGDYVNGSKVISKDNYLLWLFDNEEHNTKYIGISNIKSIVTKECFENMKYEVE